MTCAGFFFFTIILLFGIALGDNAKMTVSNILLLTTGTFIVETVFGHKNHKQ